MHPYTRGLVNGVPLLVLTSFAVICLTIRRTSPVRTQVLHQSGLVLCLTIVTVAAVTPMVRPIPSGFLEIPDIRAFVYGASVLVWALFAGACLAIRGALKACIQWVRQSGLFLYLAIAIVAAVIILANPIPRKAWEPWEVLTWRIIVFGVITNVGYAVLCMLVVLTVTDRYRPARSTADSVGRVLAWQWITLLILERGRWFLEAAQIM